MAPMSQRLQDLIKAHWADLDPLTVEKVRDLTDQERSEFLAELRTVLPKRPEDRPHTVQEWNGLTGLQLPDTPASQAKITHDVQKLWNELAEPPLFPGMHWS